MARHEGAISPKVLGRAEKVQQVGAEIVPRVTAFLTRLWTGATISITYGEGRVDESQRIESWSLIEGDISVRGLRKLCPRLWRSGVILSMPDNILQDLLAAGEDRRPAIAYYSDKVLHVGRLAVDGMPLRDGSRELAVRRGSGDVRFCSGVVDLANNFYEGVGTIATPPMPVRDILNAGVGVV